MIKRELIKFDESHTRENMNSSAVIYKFLGFLIIVTAMGCKSKSLKTPSFNQEFMYMIILENQKDHTLNRLQNFSTTGEYKYKFDWVQLSPGDTVYVIEDEGPIIEDDDDGGEGKEMDYLVYFNGKKGWINQELYNSLLNSGSIKEK